MIDDKLKGDLRRNANKILEIMERNGFDVSRYRNLAEELKEKDQKKKEHAKTYRQNYKASTTAFLHNFAYAEIKATERKKEQNNVSILSDYLLLVDEQTKLQNFLSVATAISDGKKPYYRHPTKLKSLDNTSGVLENALKKQEERRKQAKREFIEYYTKNWFLILLDLIKQTRRHSRIY